MLVEGGAYDGHTSTFTVRDNLLTLPIDIHTVLSSLGPSLLHRHPLLCEEGTRPSSEREGSVETEKLRVGACVSVSVSVCVCV